MRKLMFLSLVVLILNACGTSDKGAAKLVLKGTITNCPETNVYLMKFDKDQIFLDTAVIAEGKFTLEAEIEAPEMWYVKIGEDRRFVPFFAEAAEMTVTVDYEKFNEAVFTGSKSQTELDKYNAQNKPFEEKIQNLSMQYNEARMQNDTTKMAALQAEYEGINKEMEAASIQYVKTNNKSIVSLYLVAEQLVYSLKDDELKTIFTNFDTTLSTSNYYKRIAERIQILENVKIGMPAPDFALKDTTGAAISLSSLKGKYVLIDFWASWCQPCRKENPSVVKLYADYKAKGFEILGVSLDEDGASWKEAIHADGITWLQVSDLLGWGCEAGKLYAVNSIPHTVLLDQNGVIIAKNLRGDELRAKIAELIK